MLKKKGVEKQNKEGVQQGGQRKERKKA